MRLVQPAIIVGCALMLAAFSSFSIFAIVSVSIGAGAMISGFWMNRKVIGIVGFIVSAVGTSAATSTPDLTILSNLFAVGFLLILPLSLSLWIVLTTGSYRADAVKLRPTPYAWAALFTAVVLAAVPIAGMIMHSSRFTADVGAESQIMLIGFATALWSVALLGLDSEKK